MPGQRSSDVADSDDCGRHGDSSFLLDPASNDPYPPDIPEPGTSFDWTSYGFRVRSTMYDVDAGSRVLWGGTAEGITGMHE
jgi:hypothetical protein